MEYSNVKTKGSTDNWDKYKDNLFIAYMAFGIEMA